MIKTQVYRQEARTESALLEDGFLAYDSVKQLTMLRLLPAAEAPKTMKAGKDTITAEAGYWIAYDAGDEVKANLDDYTPRPIEPDIFAQTYRTWDEPDYRLTAPESQLQKLGCTPYYKIAKVWAKHLDRDTWVQGMESDEPSLSPKGSWLCIGAEGEPWSITEEWFQEHYRLPKQKSSHRANIVKAKQEIRIMQEKTRMTQNEIRNQEQNRHEEKVDRNVENHLAIDLTKKRQAAARTTQNAGVARAINIVYFLFGILEVMLMLRVILQLLDANAQNGFANFVYLVTAPFVALFSTLLANPSIGTSGILEITTMISMFVWALVAWALGRLIWLVTSRPRGQ